MTNITTNEANTLARVAPRQNVTETENGWRIRVELPGVAPDNLTLEAEQRVLTLEATPTEPDLPEDLHPVHQEYKSSAFAQRWRLPARVDMDAIHTNYAHGLLTIDLPYQAPEKRSVPIQVE